jgi:hypothetical protein
VLLILPLIAALSLLAPPGVPSDDPDLGCIMVVDRELKNGGTSVAFKGFTGTAQSRTDYTLEHDGERVVSWGWGYSRLSQLTWRPAQVTGQAPTTSFNCTTTAGGAAQESDRAAIGVMCLIDDKQLVTGLDSLVVQQGEIRYSALAKGYELRVAVDGGSAGFVSAWTHEHQTFGGGRTLEVAGHSFTCWRL